MDQAIVVESVAVSSHNRRHFRQRRSRSRLPFTVVFCPPAFAAAVRRPLRPRLRIRFQKPIASRRLQNDMKRIDVRCRFLHTDVCGTRAPAVAPLISTATPHTCISAPTVYCSRSTWRQRQAECCRRADCRQKTSRGYAGNCRRLTRRRITGRGPVILALPCVEDVMIPLLTDAASLTPHAVAKPSRRCQPIRVTSTPHLLPLAAVSVHRCAG
jgi:hypothetical protein